MSRTHTLEMPAVSMSPLGIRPLVSSLPAPDLDLESNMIAINAAKVSVTTREVLEELIFEILGERNARRLVFFELPAFFAPVVTEIGDEFEVRHRITIFGTR